MPQEFTFVCPLPNSIHARPASYLVDVTSQFESSVQIHNERNGIDADAKSVLSLVGADVQEGDSCQVTVQGRDEKKAFESVKSFIENEFHGCDEPLPEIAVSSGNVILPPMLRDEGLAYLQGIPVSNGFGRGRAVIAGGLSLPEAVNTNNLYNSAEEWQSVKYALKSIQSEISIKLEEPLDRITAEILKAHLSIARDPALAEKLKEIVFQEENSSAASAIVATYEYFAATLKKAESLYIRERILDIQDVCSQLLQQIYGMSTLR